MIEVFVSTIKDGSGDDVMKAEKLFNSHSSKIFSLPHKSFAKQFNSKSTKIFKS